MALDKRVPGVYVEIEDRSYFAPTLETGESVYCVILSDRGPHNRVVELTQPSDLHRLFGKPDYAKYGQAHYLVDKALQGGAKAYVCRPVLINSDDSDTESNLMAVANAVVKYNNPISGDFQEIYGSSDSQELGVWRLSNALNVSRRLHGGSGLESAALAFGGRNSAAGTEASTEEYDGSSWALSNDLNEGRYGLAGVGTQTATLGFGGLNSNVTEEYDGTSWATVNDMLTRRLVYDGGAGISTAALAFGGWNASGRLAVTEEYDGTSWATSGDLLTNRTVASGCGIQTAALCIGGDNGSYVTYCEEYDGTSWAQGGNSLTARGQLSSCGTQAAALSIGGYNGSVLAVTEQYDGTSWTARYNMSISRYELSSAGTTSVAIGVGGYDGGNVMGYTEEYSNASAFVFTEGSTIVYVDSLAVAQFSVGDYIAHTDDVNFIKQITDVDEDNYKLTIASAYDYTYEGTMAYKYNPGATLVNYSFAWVNGSNVVTAPSAAALDYLTVGDWIYSSDDAPVLGQPASYARQIISIDSDELEITLDSNYSGTTGSATLYINVPFQVISLTNMRSISNFSTTSLSNLWCFYAYGAGSFYNDVFLKGVRNIEFEKMYTDSDGNAQYPYAFMDIAVYKTNDDGTTSLLEGPWTVSLIATTATNSPIRDINTGKELYIKTVINNNSEYIRCEEALGAAELLTLAQTYPYDPDTLKRLQVQSLFAEDNVLRVNTLGEGGVEFDNGEDGNLFSANGNLNFTDEYQALVGTAYNGTLTSFDGTVELIVQELYPRYIFDYILCGGYTAAIQNAARTLADTRNDCLVLADTGTNNSTSAADLTSRLDDVPWNTWNAMLYVQYREIFDLYTGKYFYINPVYHAIERHLHVDSKYWIAEPVANIEKGAISEPITLSYIPTLTQIGDLIDAELNPIIVEPEGKYILTQFTTWKRLSVMKRAHAVKFVQYVKKRLPTLLKDLLQRKATAYWIGQATSRIDGFMNQFLEGAGTDRYVAITSFSSSVTFDEDRSELFVVLELHPIRAIERIHVNIIVT
jgi:hypothetical protein